MNTQTITVADLAAIKQIIDTAVQRGAFQASEVKQVGEVYEKLTAFLEAVIAQAQNQGEEQPPSGEQTQGETE